MSGLDVLSDVLHTLRFKGRLFCRMELTSPWGLSDTLPDETAQFHMVERGSGWLHLPEASLTVALAPGDFILISNVQQIVLRDSAATNTIPFGQLAAGETSRIIHYGGEGVATTLLCGAFQPDAPMVMQPLLKLLPPLIHIKGSDGNAPTWLSTIIAQIGAEDGLESPGAETLVAHLIDALFIYVLRDWISRSPHQQTGWLAGLRDPLIANVLQAIHQSPQRGWTIETLGKHVGLSRSAFAARFKSVVGEAPLTYLARWRIQLAINYLQVPQNTLDGAAQMTGYESVYSFGKAFKKWVGVSPGRFREQFGKHTAVESSQSAA